jgi:hypothetical protein
MEQVTGQIEELSQSLSEEVCSYADILSLLSETNRQLKCVETQKGKIKDADQFKKESTGASVAVTGELITLESKDGDGHLRENEDAGIIVTGCGINVQTTREDSSLMDDGYIQLSSKAVTVDTTDYKDAKYDDDGILTSAQCPVVGTFNVASKNIVFEAVDKEFKNDLCKDKELAADGKIKLAAKHVEVSTAHVQNVEIDDKGKVTKGEYPADGAVRISSKNITLESVDSEFDPNAPRQRKEKSLAKDGSIRMRSEHTTILATTTEGKATGAVSLNAQKLNLLSVDTDGDKQTPAADSKIVVWANKVSLLGHKVLQAIQGEKKGDDKAFLLLKEFKANLKGKETELHGETKIVGSFDAPKVSVDNLEVKDSFKSKNISDGIAAGAAPQSSLQEDGDCLTDEEKFEEYSD